MAEPARSVLDLAVGEVGEVPLERHGTASYAWEVTLNPPGIAEVVIVPRAGGDASVGAATLETLRLRATAPRQARGAAAAAPALGRACRCGRSASSCGRALEHFQAKCVRFAAENAIKNHSSRGPRRQGAASAAKSAGPTGH